MFDIITIGTATRDVFLRSRLFKTVRDPKHLERIGFPTGEAQCFALGAKVAVEEPLLTVGGGAANTAVTFARQGYRTAAFVKLGRDSNGRAVIEDLKREKITPLAALDPKAMTGYSVILLSSGGERTILTYRGATEDLRVSDAPARRLAARWAYIVPGRIPLPAMTAIIRTLRKNGTKIAMNPSQAYLDLGAKKLMPILKHLNVITLNREEAAYLTGRRYDDEKKIFATFDEWVEGFAVMTEGPKGVLVSDGKRIYRAGIYRDQRVVDRTGAGDAFGSGFVAGLMRYRGPLAACPPRIVSEAIRLASANATAVVEAVGAQTGALRRREFAANRRWRKFTVAVHEL
jgi:ribokinase